MLLLGGSLALLVALLAWSDNIRSLTHHTRALRREFLDRHKIDRAKFRNALGADGSDVMLQAISGLIFSGALESKETSAALNLFQKWKPLEDEVKRLGDAKYHLTITLMASLAFTGLIELVADGPPLLLLILPVLIATSLAFTIAKADRKAQEFQRLINEIDERI